MRLGDSLALLFKLNMKNRPNFTNTIEEWSNFFIPLNDGVQLAARAWLPTNAIEQPVPAILEYIPYRKRDGTAIRDEQFKRDHF